MIFNIQAASGREKGHTHTHAHAHTHTEIDKWVIRQVHIDMWTGRAVDVFQREREKDGEKQRHERERERRNPKLPVINQSVFHPTCPASLPGAIRSIIGPAID